MSLLRSFDPGSLFLSLITGGVGLALFMYGKKAQRLPQVIAGLLFMVYPYFTETNLQTVIVGVVLTAGLYWAIWLGY